MKLKSILLTTAAALVTCSSFAQSDVTTAGLKYVLLEEGTGCWCGYCPDGAQRIQQTIEPAYPRCISVAFHNGDPMALSPDAFNTTYIATAAPGPGWPGATVDRTVFTHDYGTSGGIKTQVGHNRGFWSTDVGTQNALTPKFDVRMVSTYDSVARALKVKVTGKCLVAGTGTWRINAFRIEDSLSSAPSGYEQDNYMTSSPASSWFYGYPSPITPASRYSHMGVVREIYASGGSMWGDVAFTNPVVGDSVTITYMDTIPTAQVARYTRVVGMVAKYGSTTSDRAIENTIMARVRLMWKVYPTPSSVISNAAVIADMELFPNPAQNVITVKGMLEHPSPVEISIHNALGQRVFSQDYKTTGSLFGESISLTDLSNGVYFMNISSDGGSVTKQFTVNK